MTSGAKSMFACKRLISGETFWLKRSMEVMRDCHSLGESSICMAQGICAFSARCFIHEFAQLYASGFMFSVSWLGQEKIMIWHKIQPFKTKCLYVMRWKRHQGEERWLRDRTIVSKSQWTCVKCIWTSTPLSRWKMLQLLNYSYQCDDGCSKGVQWTFILYARSSDCLQSVVLPVNRIICIIICQQPHNIF